MVMGTASTMTAIVETLGLTLARRLVDSGGGFQSRAHGRRRRAGCVVDMVWEDLKPRDILTRKSFENAITVLMALGGSTNALVHVVAMAGRAGVPLPLEDFDAFSKRTPLICNLRPSGKYLMEDFYYAGGLPRAAGRAGRSDSPR